MPKRKLVKKGVPGSGRPLAFVLLISFAAVLVLVGSMVWYIGYEGRRTEQRIRDSQREAVHQAIVDSNRKWCDIVVLFDDTYRATPPTTPAGQKIAAYFTNLRKDFQCP